MEHSVNIRELVLMSLLEMQKEEKPCHIVMREVLEKYQYLSRQERAFYTRLCEGTLENRLQLDYIINRFSKVPVRKMKPVVREILRLSVYQMKEMDSVPDSAVVNEAVRLAQKKGFKTLKGFVNGVLRNISRNLETVEYPTIDDPIEYFKVVYSMPEELSRQWIRDYGKEITEKICRAFLQPAPTTIRIRRTDTDREAVIESLREQGVTMEKAPYIEDALYISDYNYLQRLQAMKKGQIFVQDVSSMIAVHAAGIKEGDTVLDLCAAPGGKTLLAADLLNGSGRVIAGDLTEYKTELIRENVERASAGNVVVRCRDASLPDPDMKEKADVVIADVPCSGYGVIGRKPDIKYGADAEKQKELVGIQRSILENAVACVKPGGTLLFSTCTVSRVENEENVSWLLDHFELEAVSLDSCLCEELHSETTAKGWLQLIPGVHACDGFFVAKFRKKSE